MSLIEKALGHMKAGQTDTAIDLLQQHLDQQADDEMGLEFLLQALAQKEDWPAARATAERLTRAHPNAARHWYTLGLVLSKLHKAGEAAEALRRSVALAPRFTPAKDALRKVERQLRTKERPKRRAVPAREDSKRHTPERAAKPKPLAGKTAVARRAAEAKTPPSKPPSARNTPEASSSPAHAGKCPFCQSMMKTGTAQVRCPLCDTPHHADCWEENGGCAVYGCSGHGPISRPDEAPLTGGLIHCPMCSGLVSPEAETCPHCGHPMPEARYRAAARAILDSLLWQNKPRF